MPTGLTEVAFPFLAGLSPAGRRELVALAPTRARAGARLLSRGEAAGGAYFVVGGALRVYYVSAEGREATLYRVERGGTCVLSLSATFSAEPFPAWVTAGPAGGSFVRVPSPTFHRLLDGESAFRSFVIGALAARILDLMVSLEETGSAAIEQRVARYLLRGRGADGCVHVTQAGIAVELGTAREVVYRALKSLSARKLIETARGRIRILDPARLARAAEPDYSPQPGPASSSA
jgi:CRP/FNR family transcriptional regulator